MSAGCPVHMGINVKVAFLVPDLVIGYKLFVTNHERQVDVQPNV